MTEFSDRARALRHRLNLSQQAMADRLCISRSHYNRLENGQEPGRQTLMQLKLMERTTDLEESHDVRKTHSGPKLHVEETALGYSSMRINPQYELSDKTKSATRQDCDRLYLEWITAAEADPNGLSYAYKFLKKHLDLDDFVKDSEVEG